MKRAVITAPYPTPEQIAKFYGMSLAKVREFWELPFQTEERKHSSRPNGRAKKRTTKRKARTRR